MLWLRNKGLYITELVANALHQPGGKYVNNGNQFFGVREPGMLKLLSAGNTVNEIALETGGREQTVSAIISGIKAKAAVESLDELLKYAEDMDLN